MNVRISPQVREDLLLIREYFSSTLQNPTAAERLTKQIINRISRLQKHPQMGAPLSSVVEVETDYRFLVCGHYLIFYRKNYDAVFVSRILHGKRDLIRILFSDRVENEESQEDSDEE